MPPRLEENVESERLHLMVPHTLTERIDAWRRQQPGDVKKGEAIRELLEFALAQKEQSEPRRKRK